MCFARGVRGLPGFKRGRLGQSAEYERYNSNEAVLKEGFLMRLEAKQICLFILKEALIKGKYEFFQVCLFRDDHIRVLDIDVWGYGSVSLVA